VIGDLALRVLACGLIGLTSGALAPRLADSAEPGQRIVRVAFVDPYAPSAFTARETSAFWTRLRELG
jgi:hypothetical protein